MRPLEHPDERRLVTIPISHYCEKARWALDRAGLDYVEERHVQVLHRRAVRRLGGAETCPVLATPEGVFADSRAIVFYADAGCEPDQRLYPPDPGDRAAVLALEERWDTLLGPEGRLWMYFQTLTLPEAFARFNLTGVPDLERRAWPLLFRVMTPMVKRHLGVSASSAARAERNVDAELDAAAAMLADGRPFLTGDRFTAADLTFAALCAPLVVPPQYGVPLPQPEDMPEAMARRVRGWREHPAGAFALRMFATQRTRPAGDRAV